MQGRVEAQRHGEKGQHPPRVRGDTLCQNPEKITSSQVMGCRDSTLLFGCSMSHTYSAAELSFLVSQPTLSLSFRSLSWQPLARNTTHQRASRRWAGGDHGGGARRDRARRTGGRSQGPPSRHRCACRRGSHHRGISTTTRAYNRFCSKGATVCFEFGWMPWRHLHELYKHENVHLVFCLA